MNGRHATIRLASVGLALAAELPAQSPPRPESPATPNETPAPAIAGPVVALLPRGDDLLLVSTAGVAALTIGSDAEPRPERTRRGRERIVALAATGESAWTLALEIGSGSTIAALDAERQLRFDEELEALAASPSGVLAVGDGDGVVRILPADLDPERVAAPIAAHAGSCRALAFDPAGVRLASGGRDGAIVLLDCATAADVREIRAPELRAHLRDHTAGVECLSWSADGTVLASGARDGRVRFHDRDGRLLRSVDAAADEVLAITALSDGRFAWATAAGEVFATAPTADAPLHAFEPRPGPVFSLAVHGGRLWLGGLGTVASVALERES